MYFKNLQIKKIQLMVLIHICLLQIYGMKQQLKKKDILKGMFTFLKVMKIQFILDLILEWQIQFFKHLNEIVEHIEHLISLI